MKKYTIQLSAEAAPMTVTTREAVDRIVTLHDRLKRARANAYPYFVFPVSKNEEILRGIDMQALSGEGFDFKAGYISNLAYALTHLCNVEAGYCRKHGDKPTGGRKYLGHPTTEIEREAYEVLSLIEEFNALPLTFASYDEAGYKTGDPIYTLDELKRVYAEGRESCKTFGGIIDVIDAVDTPYEMLYFTDPKGVRDGGLLCVLNDGLGD